MGKRLSKFTSKLTDEMKIAMMKESACGKTLSEVSKFVKEKYGVVISPQRVNGLKGSKKYGEIYDVIRREYRNKLADLSDIEIYAKRERLQDAEKIRKKLFNILDKIDSRISDKVKLTKYDIQLIRELRSMAEIHIKTLKYAQDESKEIENEGRLKNKPSLLQFVDKQQVIMGKNEEDTEKTEEGSAVNGESVQGNN